MRQAGHDPIQIVTADQSALSLQKREDQVRHTALNVAKGKVGDALTGVLELLAHGLGEPDGQGRVATADAEERFSRGSADDGFVERLDGQILGACIDDPDFTEGIARPEERDCLRLAVARGPIDLDSPDVDERDGRHRLAGTMEKLSGLIRSHGRLAGHRLNGALIEVSHHPAALDIPAAGRTVERILAQDVDTAQRGERHGVPGAIRATARQALCGPVCRLWPESHPAVSRTMSTPRRHWVPLHRR